MKRKRLELVVLLFAAVFLSYLIYSFRPGRRPASGASKEAMPALPGAANGGQPTTVLKQFEYTETVRGKPAFRIRADRTVGFGAAAGLMPDLYALEKVTLTVYPDTGSPVTVNADRATYDHRTSEAHLNGNVRWVDGRGALGETEEISFNPSARVLSAPKAVRLTRGTFVLEGRSGRYDVAKREAHLEGPIRGTGSGESTGGLTSLAADRAVYRRDEETIELSGAVSGATSSGTKVAADAMVLKTAEEGRRFEWARADGHVSGVIAGASLPGVAAAGAAGAGPRPPQTYAGDRAGLLFAADGTVRSLSLTGSPARLETQAVPGTPVAAAPPVAAPVSAPSALASGALASGAVAAGPRAQSSGVPARKLRASTIEVDFDGGRARSARATGSVQMESAADRAESDSAMTAIDAAGEVESLELTGSVKMEGDGRLGRADHALNIPARSTWVLTGASGRSASVEGDGSKVSATKIEIDQKQKTIRAEGAARAVLTPKKDGANLASPVGDSSKPTFGKADRMTFDDGSHVATLSGHASLWQEASSVNGNDITVNDAERTLVAVGNTRTVFTVAAGAAGATGTAGTVGAAPASPSPSSSSPTTKPSPRRSATPTTSDRRPSIVTARRLVYREPPGDRPARTPPPGAPATLPRAPSSSPAPADAGASTARFDGDVAVTSGEWRASSSEATAWLGKDRKLDRVELTGDVAFQDSKEGRSGKADHATDWPRDGKTVLEGRPAVVVDREGNRVAGATLTISKRGGSVEVTAPEGGRTETIHKTSADAHHRQ